MVSHTPLSDVGKRRSHWTISGCGVSPTCQRCGDEESLDHHWLRCPTHLSAMWRRGGVIGPSVVAVSHPLVSDVGKRSHWTINGCDVPPTCRNSTIKGIDIILELISQVNTVLVCLRIILSQVNNNNNRRSSVSSPGE